MQLRAQMEVNQPVIALQEISTAWAGRLYPFFLSRDYEFITSHYGKPFNGYMGVALAYPRGKYDLLDADIKRISDVKAWPDPPPCVPRGGCAVWVWDHNPSACVTPCLCFLKRCLCRVEKAPTPTLLEQLATLFSKVLQALGLVSRPSVGRPKRDTWGHARSRSNTMVSLRLADRSDPDAKFSVSTYHMPCAFYDPPMMTIHSALSAQHAHAVADGLPYVYMGDFNLKPGDGGYRLLTNGELPDDDDAQPTPRPGDPWRPTLSVPLTSAYAAVLGKEPLATNHTISFADHKPFTDCLDYIFCSPGIKPVDVMQLADPSTVPPSPNAQEPSDHWMVAAALELPKAP